MSFQTPYPDEYAIVVGGSKNIRSTPDARLNNVRRKTRDNEMIPVLGVVDRVDGTWFRLPEGWIHGKTAIKTVVPNSELNMLGAFGAGVPWEQWINKAATAASPLTKGLVNMEIPKEVRVGVDVSGSPNVNIRTDMGTFVKNNWPWFAAGGIVLVSIIGSVVAVTRKK